VLPRALPGVHLCNFWWQEQQTVVTELSQQSKALCRKCRIILCMLRTVSRGSLFGIATGYGPDGRGIGVRATVVSRIFPSPCLPDRLSGPRSLLVNGYQGFSPGDKCGKLIIHLQLVPRSRTRESILPAPHTSTWRSA
jgi:hypothetical protein